MRALIALAAGSYLIAAFVAASMGLDWLIEGFGLHPALAFPFALASACLAYWTASIWDAIRD